MPLDNNNECILKSNTDKYYYTYYIKNCVEIVNTFYATDSPSDTYKEGFKCNKYARYCTNQANEETKKCIEWGVPTGNNLPNEGYYIDGSSDNTCYSKCPDTYPYYYGNKFYSSTSAATLSGKHRVYGTNKFIDECKDGYYAFNDLCC